MPQRNLDPHPFPLLRRLRQGPLRDASGMQPGGALIQDAHDDGQLFRAGRFQQQRAEGCFAGGSCSHLSGGGTTISGSRCPAPSTPRPPCRPPGCSRRCPGPAPCRCSWTAPCKCRRRSAPVPELRVALGERREREFRARLLRVAGDGQRLAAAGKAVVAVAWIAQRPLLARAVLVRRHLERGFVPSRDAEEFVGRQKRDHLVRAGVEDGAGPAVAVPGQLAGRSPSSRLSCPAPIHNAWKASSRRLRAGCRHGPAQPHRPGDARSRCRRPRRGTACRRPAAMSLPLLSR